MTSGCAWLRGPGCEDLEQHANVEDLRWLRQVLGLAREQAALVRWTRC